MRAFSERGVSNALIDLALLINVLNDQQIFSQYVFEGDVISQPKPVQRLMVGGVRHKGSGIGAIKHHKCCLIVG